MSKFILLTSIILLLIFGTALAKEGVPEREYRVAVVLFNESEFDSAEEKFTTVIENGDMSIPEAVPYVVSAYYGRASCRIEEGRKLKQNKKFKEAMEKYESAYNDLITFKTKFEELQRTLKQNQALYDEMEKHFMVVSDQIVQLAGEAGDLSFNQGLYDRALVWYDKGLQVTDVRSNVYGNLIYAKADASFQLGRYQDALRLLAKFENELSNHQLKVKAMFYAADIYRIMAENATDPKLKQQYLRDARSAYSQVVDIIPDVTNEELIKNSLLEKGRCEKQLGQDDEAIRSFTTLITNYPNTRHAVDAQLELGDYAFTARQFGKAIENFSKAIETAKSLNMLDLMAIGYYWLGWSYFSEASNIDIQSSPELIKRSKTLFERSRQAFEDSNKNAEKFWKKEGREVQMAKELEGYYGESIYMIGRCYQRLERWDDAIKTFESISPAYQKWRLKGMAEIAVSKERKGDINGSMQKWDQLKEELTKARIPDIEEDLLMRRADSIFDIQRYDEAEKAYREIVEKYPNSENAPKAMLYLGLSMFKQNKNREAIQQFSNLLSKYGKDEKYQQVIGDALFWKGYLSARTGNSDDEIKANLMEAIRNYRELVSRFPSNPRADDASFEIGFCTYSLGAYDEKNYAKAIEEYTKVLQNYPNSEYADDALFEIARCYKLINDEVNEEKALRLLVQTYSDSELADNALLRIAEVHFQRAQKSKKPEERRTAEESYSQIILKYPNTESSAIAYFQLASIYYKLDKDFQRSAADFGKCVSTIEGLLNKVSTGGPVPADLDVTVLANLLLRASFWQAESMFQIAKQLEWQAQPSEVVKQAYAKALDAYQQVIARGTNLRTSFPQKAENLYNIMDGEKLEIPIITETQFMIGRCLYKMGDFEKAKAQVTTIKSPDNLKMKADYLLALIAFEQGKLDEAKSLTEAWLSKVRELPDEYSVEMQVLLAKIDLAKGNVSQARSKALDIWALNQSINGLWEEAAYVVAKSYKLQNDTERARSWINRLQSSPYQRWKLAAQELMTQTGK